MVPVDTPDNPVKLVAKQDKGNTQDPAHHMKWMVKQEL